MAVVVLTGCSSGFGFEGALAFARNGDNVYATMRDTGKAQPLITAATADGLALHIKQLDVCNPTSFGTLVDDIIAEAGYIDVLVHNAGILPVGAFEDLTESGFRRVMETNFSVPWV